MAVLCKGLQTKDFDFEKLNCFEQEVKVDRTLSASLKQSTLDKLIQN